MSLVFCIVNVMYDGQLQEVEQMRWLQVKGQRLYLQVRCCLVSCKGPVPVIGACGYHEAFVQILRGELDSLPPPTMSAIKTLSLKLLRSDSEQGYCR